VAARTAGRRLASRHTYGVLVEAKRSQLGEQEQWEYGAAGFAGFVLDASSTVLAAPPLAPRHLNFIGDSDTAGFCADGTPGGADEKYLTENNYESWSAQLAQGLNASYTAQAISGVGVLDHPWMGPMAVLLDNINTYDFWHPWQYNRTCSGPNRPDAVVVLVGPNDFIDTNGYGRPEKFIKAYLQLLNQEVHNYATCRLRPALILVCAGSGNGWDPCGLIGRVATLFNADPDRQLDGFKAHFAAMNKTVWQKINNSTHYQGCDEHYNAHGHAIVKDEIMPHLERILNWSINSTPVPP